jgi:hypothetical protein
MTTTLDRGPAVERNPAAVTATGARSPLARLAGPMAIVAGGLITVAQVVMLPYDPKDHVATSQSPAFQAGGVLYMVGFLALMLALVGAYAWEAHRAGKFGLVAVTVAVAGTMMLGGDLWFETFAVPSIADGPAAARVLDSDPSALLALGAISSYVLFAAGWALFGLASFRARVFPKVLCVGLVLAGVIGFQALLAPFAIPLGIVVALLGVWMIRASRRGTVRSERTSR